MNAIDLSRLEEKFQLLLNKMQHLQEENRELQKEVSDQRLEIDQKQQAMADLEKKVAMLKITASAGSNGQVDAESRKQLRATINAYINDLDRCIAQLNQ